MMLFLVFFSGISLRNYHRFYRAAWNADTV